MRKNLYVIKITEFFSTFVFFHSFNTQTHYECNVYAINTNNTLYRVIDNEQTQKQKND